VSDTDPRPSSEADQAWAESMESSRAKLAAAGLSEDEIDRLVDEAIEKAVSKGAEAALDELYEDAPRMLAEYQQLDDAYREEIRRLWGKPLDEFRMVLVAAVEVGERFDDRHRPPDDEPFDPMLNAQLGLHARACRIAWEVYVLLCAGLAAGALARARTVHEIAVVSSVLRQHGQTDAHADLAARFLDHAIVMDLKDAEQYQLDCEALGYDPFTEDEMAALRTDAQLALEQYGEGFRRDHGWAWGLLGDRVPTFRQMEEMAGLAHLRSHYRWASHEVHSDAKSWRLNHSTWGNAFYRVAGPDPGGLADPGHMTLLSLQQTTCELLTCREDLIDEEGLLAMATLERLIQQAGESFGEAHTSVEVLRLERLGHLSRSDRISSATATLSRNRVRVYLRSGR
jgi:hypothetical protein